MKIVGPSLKLAVVIEIYRIIHKVDFSIIIAYAAAINKSQYYRYKNSKYNARAYFHHRYMAFWKN